MASFLLPAMLTACVLGGLRARVDVYQAFVDGAKEGLRTLAALLPVLAAILMATALLRETGVLDALSGALAPILRALGLPEACAAVVLLRPLSGSAALAAVKDVMVALGPESRAARLCCVVCGASETVFFTSSLYFGAAGVKRSAYALPVALAAYGCGVLAAGALV